MRDFNNRIGLDKLVLVHANDTKASLGSRKDRHEHIGYGKIGKVGFSYLMHYPRLSEVDWLLETPKDDSDANDLEALRRLRKK